MRKLHRLYLSPASVYGILQLLYHSCLELCLLVVMVVSMSSQLSLLLVVVGRSVVMALAVMAITFLPASNLFFRVGFVIAERNLYLPLSGYCILFSLGAVQISSFRHLREVLQMFLCCIIFTFCFSRKSFQRMLRFIIF